MRCHSILASWQQVLHGQALFAFVIHMQGQFSSSVNILCSKKSTWQQWFMGQGGHWIPKWGACWHAI